MGSNPKQTTTLSTKDALSVAMSLHQAGHLMEAKSVYGDILEADPDQPEALHFLGVLSQMLGESDSAEKLIRKAIEVAPDYTDAQNNLGNILKEQGRLQEAETMYRKVIAGQPSHASAHNNLGIVLKEQQQYDEAQRCFEKAIALQPDHVDAHYNLGNLLRRSNKPDEAISAYERAIALCGDHLEARRSLGAALTNLGKYEEAIDAYKTALAVKPDDTVARQGLGSTLYKAGRTAEAVQFYRDWLELEPADPIAKHMLAACSGEQTPARASDDYVRRTFDGFAKNFDGVLKGLDYSAPQLVASAVAKELGERDAGLSVLDAGCGTGLCGPLLRPLASRLTGVDLSEGMVDRARECGAYDELLVAELTAFLSDSQKAYDLIVSADTFCYFGDLQAVFSGVYGALRDGGNLAFTLEHAEEDTGSSYKLEPHGRYSHSKAYVEATIAAVGLRLRSIDAATLRKERGKPVSGLVMVAGKDRSSSMRQSS